MHELEKEIVKLIRKLAPMIDQDLTELEKLVSIHGEYGIALENLCAILEERNIAIEFNDLQQILTLFKRMSFADDIIAYYSKSIKTI